MALTAIQTRPSPASPAPLFRGGLLDGLAYGAQVVDSHKLLNLMTLDVGGMVLPRSFLEYRERGADMGRETFIREAVGTLCMVFLAGWTGWMARQAFNRTQAARGAQVAPWINWRSMEHYSRLLDTALGEAASPQEARTRFVRSALQSLHSSDAAIAPGVIRGALAGVENATLREALLGQDRQIARKTLSPQAVDDLAAMLAPSHSPEKGVYQIAARIAQQGLPPTSSQWAALSRESAHHAGAIATTLAQRAQADGLSATIHAVDATGQPFLKGRNLSTTLGELRTFLEQYADRALADPHRGEILAQPLDEAERARIRAALFARGASRAEDGLVTLARRNRRWLTMLPLGLTVLIAASVAFLNNWLTQKKHHGEVFFPGEGGPLRRRGMMANAPAPGLGSGGVVSWPAGGYRATGGASPWPSAAANASVFDVFQARRPAGLQRPFVAGGLP